MVVINNRTQDVIVDQLVMAKSFYHRFKGWMGYWPSHGEGLMIRPCQSIHCFFMKVSIDVLFVNEYNVVVHIERNMKPRSISSYIGSAKYVIEGLSGAFDDVRTNDILLIKS